MPFAKSLRSSNRAFSSTGITFSAICGLNLLGGDVPAKFASVSNTTQPKTVLSSSCFFQTHSLFDPFQPCKKQEERPLNSGTIKHTPSYDWGLKMSVPARLDINIKKVASLASISAQRNAGKQNTFPPPQQNINIAISKDLNLEKNDAAETISPSIPFGNVEILDVNTPLPASEETFQKIIPTEALESLPTEQLQSQKNETDEIQQSTNQPSHFISQEKQSENTGKSELPQIAVTACDFWKQNIQVIDAVCNVACNAPCQRTEEEALLELLEQQIHVAVQSGQKVILSGLEVDKFMKKYQHSDSMLDDFMKAIFFEVVPYALKEAMQSYQSFPEIEIQHGKFLNDEFVQVLKTQMPSGYIEFSQERSTILQVSLDQRP